MTDNKIQRMQQLVRELNEASDAYYNGQSELMTDYEWDARFDELKRLETETGTTLPASHAEGFGRNHQRTERGARVCSPLAGQDQADGRTHQVG